ncbi:MAG TPA: hypothetical protein VHZ31_08935 [Solirubrobacteraceae bacterium]|jgi:uncharacterized membrane protein|nr:hypothetical protein [Solirubrobacteraceae bacterium]
MEAELVVRRIERGDPFWPAQVAVAAAIGLNFALPEAVTVGPTWLLPIVEGILLAVLVTIAPRRATAHSRRRRRLSLAVVGVVSLANIASLVLLVHYLVAGGHVGGQRLILAGAVLWATSVLLFAVWFWEMDRGGPVTRYTDPDTHPDFQFPQMENPQLAPPGWRPGFGDYLYVSVTNATAFSPTDTLPLTQTAKLVMAIQSLTALLTIGLVIARAVNILG